MVVLLAEPISNTSIQYIDFVDIFNAIAWPNIPPEKSWISDILLSCDTIAVTHVMIEVDEA